MPDSAKEVVKVAVETSGSLSTFWQWLIGGIGTCVVGVWGHVTGRIKKLEDTVVTAKVLKDHIDDENDKFVELFRKHEMAMEKLSVIGQAVARIEGKINR